MKENEVNQNEAVYMCARNKDVDAINEKYFEMNANKSVVFKNKFRYLYGSKSVDKLPKTNRAIRELQKRGTTVTLKLDMRVMVTENIDVPKGICNGTVGNIVEINDNVISIKTGITKSL